MPIYEFVCERCDGRFEDLVEADTQAAPCPDCGAESTHRVYSPQGASFKLVKTPAQTRRQERRNDQFRKSAKRRFKEARNAARGNRGGEG
ncbi:MAG: FmdB family zinc ribbon protein [Solirubrobacterales bacterium]